MFKFPEKIYTDVRIEHVFKTQLTKKQGDWQRIQEKEYSAAFIRMFDGKKWFYSAVSDPEDVQPEIEHLLKMLHLPEKAVDLPTLKPTIAEKMSFVEKSVKNISLDKKKAILEEYESLLNSEPELVKKEIYYEDFYIVKEIYSSKGTKLKFDSNMAGISLRYGFGDGKKVFDEFFEKAFDDFGNLKEMEAEAISEIAKGKDFFHNSKPIEPGKYTAILSPQVAGVFAHESFGHKSEADFMLNDDSMRQEWQLGREVGNKVLSIIDDGNLPGSGYTPFDDEGTPAEKTFLIKDGKLMGRLHSAETSQYMEEHSTGNCRALNFEFEPIVRMTNTYIDQGDLSKDELFAGVKDGIYVESLKHGSGMSTFTIAPSRSYLIKDGKVTDPVAVSVITGNVMETLHEVDGISDQVEICSFLKGGCGKMEQYPLPVSFGGPYIRVQNMDFQ